MSRGIAGLLLGVCSVLGQTLPPLMFDVASVKASKPTGEGSMRERVEVQPGSLIMGNVRFTRMVQFAYGVQEHQVTGPGWINDERFDLAAKAGAPAPESDLRTMLQGLLAERFKLSTHRQTKEISAYAVSVGKEGHKLKPSSTEGPTSMKPTGLFAGTAERVDLDEIAALLARPLQAPVINMTGLKGRYDFSVDLSEYITPELLNTKFVGPSAPAEIISIGIAAMKKHLGLTVEWRKVPVEMVVVDRAEKTPAEN